MPNELQIGGIDHHEAVLRAVKQRGKAWGLGKHVPEALKLLLALWIFHGMIAVRHLRFFADRRRSMGCDCECAHKDVDANGVTAQLARRIRILAAARWVYQVPDFPD
jgi:hypothetical protein